jgi:glucose 1-dehydrogenase
MVTRTAGVELAPHGIRVVGPGPEAVATPINLVEMKQVGGGHPPGPDGPARGDRRRRRLPGRAGRPLHDPTTVFSDAGIMMQSPGL